MPHRYADIGYWSGGRAQLGFQMDRRRGDRCWIWGELPDLERQRWDSPNQTTRIPTHLLPSFVTRPRVHQPTAHHQSLNLGENQNYLNATIHSFQKAQRLLPASLTWPSANRKTSSDTQEYLDSFFSHHPSLVVASIGEAANVPGLR